MDLQRMIALLESSNGDLRLTNQMLLRSIAEKDAIIADLQNRLAAFEAGETQAPLILSPLATRPPEEGVEEYYSRLAACMPYYDTNPNTLIKKVGTANKRLKRCIRSLATLAYQEVDPRLNGSDRELVNKVCFYGRLEDAETEAIVSVSDIVRRLIDAHLAAGRSERDWQDTLHNFRTVLRNKILARRRRNVPPFAGNLELDLETDTSD